MSDRKKIQGLFLFPLLIFFIISVLVIPAFISNCSENNSRKVIADKTVFQPGSRLLYILQKADYGILYDAVFDVAVVDPDDSGLTAENILNLKNQGKTIISYLSIGEAENYRNYWQKGWVEGFPDFIDEENPYWEGNFKVKYWYDEWEDIVFIRLDKILKLGYDGVYLDVVDAYKYYEEKGYYYSKDKMKDFVIKIAGKAKSENPCFLIVPQNAEELVLDSKYLDSIDGLGRENLWFEKDIKISSEEMNRVLNCLEQLTGSNKFVFAISYAENSTDINDFLKLCKKYGFIPFVGKKELDSIGTVR
ncbi:MAG: endo alpha-1,4 polygalactosaminidase [Actinobacteria bacterium]|nr:endo alpha-1,4 polygalactosaminidase [Actinomycetota bacterium]